MDQKKLLSMAILGALATTRLTFGMSADLAKSTIDSVDDIASYFSGVKVQNRINNTIWNMGQKGATKMMDWTQKSVKDWGNR